MLNTPRNWQNGGKCPPQSVFVQISFKWFLSCLRTWLQMAARPKENLTQQVDVCVCVCVLMMIVFPIFKIQPGSCVGSLGPLVFFMLGRLAAQKLL